MLSQQTPSAIQRVLSCCVQVLLRALRDFNMGKLTADDTSIFMGLLNDLFPKTAEHVPRALDDSFEAKVILPGLACLPKTAKHIDLQLGIWSCKKHMRPSALKPADRQALYR